ncbi:MAG: hypothetical protein LH645_13365 [Actinomycetia bacterium]|nr:hypothetical protein [Actinomycetes bacterium]
MGSRIAFWAALAQDGARPVQTSLPTEPLMVASPPTDLAAPVDTLLGNIFAHTAAGTPFSVALVRNSDGAVLAVTDSEPRWRPRATRR